MKKEILQSLKSFYSSPDWIKLDSVLELFKSADPEVNLNLYNNLESVLETVGDLYSLTQRDLDKKEILSLKEKNNILAKKIRNLRISALTSSAGNSNDDTQFMLHLERMVESYEDQINLLLI